ncbi:hypothetical protein Verru16b_00608 [Lacunisphaera limnophila]|uniref:Uncharacterized protein n=1 Tax=Lacunisphaera limnophila TaxID=1838286 RepID=A0A1D8ARN8_9BACT|nr:hypothetical protein Verru16b_00608 [Lacunisphaera limnophila]
MEPGSLTLDNVNPRPLPDQIHRRRPQLAALANAMVKRLAPRRSIEAPRRNAPASFILKSCSRARPHALARRSCQIACEPAPSLPPVSARLLPALYTSVPALFDLWAIRSCRAGSPNPASVRSLCRVRGGVRRPRPTLRNLGPFGITSAPGSETPACSRDSGSLGNPASHPDQDPAPRRPSPRPAPPDRSPPEPRLENPRDHRRVTAG